MYMKWNTELYRGYLCSLSDGGTPAKFLIIDDGWQQIESLNDVVNDDGHDGAE